MTKASRTFALFLLAPALFACSNEERNYAWYMQHPLELRQEITKCQSRFSQNNSQTKCEMIMHAALNMTAIVNQQQTQPEKFGQRVLDAEERLGQLKLLVISAQQAVTELKNKNASPAELKVAVDDVEKAKKACNNQREEIRILLAVLGMGSPD